VLSHDAVEYLAVGTRTTTLWHENDLTNDTTARWAYETLSLSPYRLLLPLELADYLLDGFRVNSSSLQLPGELYLCLNLDLNLPPPALFRGVRMDQPGSPQCSPQNLRWRL